MTEAVSSAVPGGTLGYEALLDLLKQVSLWETDWVSLTIAAPLIEPEVLFASRPEEDSRVFWASGAERIDVGLGVALRFELGAQTISEVSAETQRLRNSYRGVGMGAVAVEPIFYGGVAFPGGRPGSLGSPWGDFAKDEFTLPRWLYRTDSVRASVTLFARRADLLQAQQRSEFAREMLAISGFRAAYQKPVSPPRLVSTRQSPSRAMWDQQVREACEKFRLGALEKVVLARELALQCQQPPDPAALLLQLNQRKDGSVCFAIARGGSTFLGSTPEHLVIRRGSQIFSEALAGSANARNPAAIQALMQGAKDRLEHGLVAREIVSQLKALGAEVVASEEPELRQFGQLAHLRTHIRARRLQPPHVLELCRQLHPTPAVGGLPKPAALEFINSHETFERGRYASPLGWFDCSGDGEFVVALRSGLIRQSEVRLFAGAGLVIGSEPEAEWNETELKFRSFLDALGLSSASLSGSEHSRSCSET